MFTRARVQLTLSFTAALALVLAAAGTATYLLVQRTLDADIRSAIEGAAAELRALDPSHLGDGAPPHAAPTPASSGDDGEADDDDRKDDDRSGRGGGDDSRDNDDTIPPAIAVLPVDTFYVTVTRSGSVLANPRRVNLDGADLAGLVERAREDGRQDEISAESGDYRVAAYPTPLQADGEPVYLVVGHSLEARNRDLATLLRTLVVAGGAGVLLSIVGGYWLSGRALAPIRESMESQRRFLSDASHELRTPLAVLRANNELLQRHPEQPIGENLEQVEAVALEAEHMSRLVDDLLTLARADEGRLLGARGLVDLADLCRGVVRDAQPLAAAKEIALALEATPALVEGDEQRLRQLVLILVDNAVKYTPPGGRVDVACGRHGRAVTLSVSDTGPGIPAAERERIFERFARLESARGRTASGGTGLGLAIAREIAAAHGGRIAVEPRPGGGTVFSVRLRASG